MTESMESLVERLKTPELPVLRRTIAEISRLGARGEKMSTTELASVILRDPLMTLKVLQVANGARSRHFGSEITTVEHALLMLGIPPFFSHFSKLTAVEDRLQEQQQALTGLMKAFSRAYHAAYQAQDWAILRTDIKAEEVYIAALLFSMAEMLMWCLAPELAQRIESAARSGKNAEAAQKEALGFMLREVRPALASAWGLPELPLDLMDCANVGNSRTLNVLLAVSLARHADSGWHGSEIEVDMEEAAAFLRAPLDDTVTLIHRNAVSAARQWKWYGVPPAAAWLPLLPGEWPAEATETGPAKESCLMPQADKLQRAKDEIGAHLDGSLNLHDMISLVLQGMREGIGLNRVVFALLSPDRRSVKAKYVSGVEEGSPLKQFQFDLSAGHLFARLMGKMQGVWLNQSNRQTIAPLLTPEILGMIGEGEFFAMSVFAHGNPVGLFYADRKHGPCTLDEPGYQEFKQLCLRAAQGLEHVAKQSRENGEAQ